MLVLRYEKASAERIVDVNLTKRRRAANGRFTSVSGGLQIVVEYPEPGVMRCYCGGDVCVWIDAVVNPGDFRPSAESRKG